jgi:small subunit ribosomal protein S12
MPTLNQLTNIGGQRHRKFKARSRSHGLCFCPHKKGTCTKVTTMKPKKPNSATRKIAKVKLSTGRKVRCYIPGEGHNLREYSQVLVRGGFVPDLPGIQYHLVRGKFDFDYREKREVSVIRTSGRSKYGIPRDSN